MLKSNPVVKKLMEGGEAQVAKLVQQLLSNEKFVMAVQTVVQKSLSAKGTFDRNLRAALSAMNLPSTADLDQLREKVGELESLLTRLDEKVGALVEQRAAEKPEKKAKGASA